jgi:hypothetical protein
MARVCARTKLTYSVLVALLAMYVVALTAVSANPMDAPPHGVHLATQGTNVVMLGALLLAVVTFNRRGGCASSSVGSVGILFVVMAINVLARLGVAGYLAAQGRSVDNLRAKYTRWDAAVAVLGTLAVLQQVYYATVPRVRLRTSFFVLALLFALPLVSTAAHMINGTQPAAAKLRASVAASKAAYDAFDGQDHATRVVAEVIEGVLYVAFAGTENSTDARIDASIGDVRVPPEWVGGASVRAHAGFVRLYGIIRPTVHGLVRKHSAAGAVTEIVACGHSLGGALATLAALDLAHNTPAVTPVATPAAVVHMYSFGAPQVGDGAFVGVFNARVPHAVRVVIPFDPVPRSLSAQLVHTKGAYPVATLTAVTPLRAHKLGSYAAAIQHPQWRRLVGMFAPSLLVGLAAALVVLYHSTRG